MAALLSALLPLSVEAATFTLGTETTYNNITELPSGALLDATHAIVVYPDAGASNVGNAAIATIDGTSVSFGSEYQICASACYSISVAALDSTHAVISYEHDGDGYAVVATVSGSTISYGTPATFDSSIPVYSNETRVIALDATHIVILYTTETGMAPFTTRNQYLVAATVGGGTLTFGSAASLSSDAGYYIGLSAMDSTHFIAGYVDNNTAKVIAGSVSGASVTVGSPVSLSSSTSDLSVSALDTTHAVLTYRASSDKAASLVATRSGNSVSVGSAQDVTSGTTYFPTATALDDAHAILVFRNQATDHLIYTKELTVSSGLVSGDTAVLVSSQDVTNTHLNAVRVDDSTALVLVKNTATVATTDTTGPDAVSSLTASASGDSIELAWTNPVNADLSSITVRRGTSGYPASATNGTPVSSGTAASSLTDDSLADGTYYYSVFARDLRGNYSSATTASATVDTTPTASPSGLSATANGNDVLLAWTNPVDADFSSITIRRGTAGYPSSVTQGTSVASGLTGTSRTDSSLSNGTYYYVVFALDAHGNVSVGAQASVTIATTASSSSSSSVQSQRSHGGGRRGSPGRGGATAAPPRAAAPSSGKAPSVLQTRTCERVAKWFTGDAKMLGRVNARLEKRFGFACAE